MKALKNVFLFFIISIIVTNTSFGQNDAKAVIEFDLLREKAQDLVSRKTDSAEIYAQQLMQIAKASKSEQFLADALSTLSLVKIYQGKQDEALQLNEQSFEINKKTKNDKELANNYYRFGTLCNNKSDFINASKYFLNSLELSEKEKLFLLKQKCYRKLSGISITQEKFNEALGYALKAIETEKLSPGDDIDKAENLFALATCYKYLKKSNFAETNYKEAYRLYTKENYQMKAADVLSEMAAVYNETDLIKSLKISLEARNIFDKIGPEMMASINNLGNLAEGYYMLAQNDSLIKKINTPEIPDSKQKLLNQAELYLIKSIGFSKEQDIQQAILYYSGLLSDIQAYKGDYKNAYSNLQYKFKYRDSLFSQENKNAIAKLQTEKEILQLKNINEKKSTLNKILIGSATGLLLFGFSGYRNFKNKQKVSNQQQQLQQQKITELEKDKQLQAIDAMLKGQEEERSRIAKDLHDGLGGMLSGTKLSFINMKDNLVLTPENAILFDKSLSMLDNTIADLRKVAHNLMPEALVKFGLDEALRDFCNAIQSSTDLMVVYQQVGENRKLTNTAEVFTYRIIQELVNNAIKHAAAKQIIVQLNINSHKLSITVEDDGKGFDKNAMSGNKGAGMDNIKYRVQYFNGTLDIVTAPGRGTSVTIELMV
jgi:two-component system, NarL family, sensor kinase